MGICFTDSLGLAEPWMPPISWQEPSFGLFESGSLPPAASYRPLA
jgi:hypothetical protein